MSSQYKSLFAGGGIAAAAAHKAANHQAQKSTKENEHVTKKNAFPSLQREALQIVQLWIPLYFRDNYGYGTTSGGS